MTDDQRLIRAFIALDISRKVLSEIDNFVSEVEGRLPGARWVNLQNLHLTLRFLGESEEGTLTALSRTVESVGARYRPFTLELRGVGFFPNPRRPRVFWAGVYEPSGVLGELHNEIEASARKHGFEPETRNFAPHLTLARFRNPRPHRGFVEVGQEFEGKVFGVSPIGEVVLYRSILKREGAEYQVLQRYPLGG